MSWTYIQNGTKTNTGSVATTTLTLTGVTAGHLLCLAVNGYTGSLTCAVSDGTANTWITGPTNGSSGSGIHLYTFYCIPTVGGTLNIVATPSSSDYTGMAIEEYSAASGSVISLAGNGSANGNSASPSSGNISFSGAGNILGWGAIASLSSTSQSATGAWTQRSNFLAIGGGSNSQEDMDQLNLAATSSPLAVTGTINTTLLWAAAGMFFLETPAAGSSTGGILIGM